MVRVVVLLAIMSATLGLGAIAAVTGAPPAAQAWIDKPLSGSSVALGPVAILAHATDASDITQVELTIGDGPPMTVDIAEPATLVMAEFEWEPAESGIYLLAVRGRAGDGGWGVPGIAMISVGDAPDDSSPSPGSSEAGSPTPDPGASSAPSSPRPHASATPRPTPGPTARPTPRPTPVPTPRPTPVPCSPAAPELTAPPDGQVIRDPALNPPTFRWAHRTPPACTPTGYRVQVFEGPDLGQLELDVTLGVTGQWTPTGPLDDCTTYSWRVATRAPGGNLGPWSSASTFQLLIGRCT